LKIKNILGSNIVFLV